MAIAFVDLATTTSAAAGTMVVNLPTHTEGDYIVLAFVHDYNSNVQQLAGVSDGFTKLTETSVSGLAHQAALYAKKAGASETNPTATYVNSTQEMACLAFAFSGIDSATQIDAGPSTWTTETPGDRSIDSPSVTTVTDGAMLVCVATGDANSTYTQPSGMTLAGNLGYINMTIAAAYQEIATAGATGAKTWSFLTVGEITAVSFAIRPAESGNTIVSVGVAAETDTALPLSHSKSVTLGIASEVDSNLGVGRHKLKTIGLAEDAASSLSLTAAKAATIGIAAEVDTALPITRIKAKAIGLPIETDSTISPEISKARVLGIATETDSAPAISSSKSVTLGIATETDAALPMVGVAPVSTNKGHPPVIHISIGISL